MRSSTRGARASARPDAGQATVEFALVLPLVLALFVLLLQVALVGRDEILVVHAARDAARAEAVAPDLVAARASAQRTLPGASVRVLAREAVGGSARVEVTYVSRTDLPLIGALVPDLTLHATAVMRVEQP